MTVKDLFPLEAHPNSHVYCVTLKRAGRIGPLFLHRLTEGPSCPETRPCREKYPWGPTMKWRLPGASGPGRKERAEVSFSGAASKMLALVS